MADEIVAFTGHRPEVLGGYSSDRSRRRLEGFADAVLRIERPSVCNLGMAQGWDQAVAIAAIRLGIPFDAFVPFEEQEKLWPVAAQARYRDLLAQARRVVLVSNGAFTAAKMHARNRRMVDESARLVALWDGRQNGGTFRCVEYARHIGREVKNVWQAWERIRYLTKGSLL